MAEILSSQFITHFRDLESYKLAFAVSLEIHRTTLEFPKIEQYAMADQLRRSSKSVCANIAEGFERQRQSKIEFKRFITIALGSCSEVQVWLDYCLQLNYIDRQQWQTWDSAYMSVSRMLYKLQQHQK